MIRSIPSNVPRWISLAILVAIALPAPAQTPTLTKYTDISLGSVVPGASAGTVVLNTPSGTRTSSGGANLGPSVGTSLGMLSLSGKAGDAWSVSAGSGIPFTLSGPGGVTMNVTVVDFEPSTTNTGTFPASGTTGFFYLGVTLSVGTSAATPAGTYIGSFSLRVNDTTNGRNSTTTFTVQAKVDPVITLSKLTDLRFGDVFTGPTAGTVILSPAGARSTTGGVGLGSLSVAGPATFSVTGAASASFGITLPASITLSSTDSSLTVTSVTSTPGLTGQLSPAGQQILAVGGTLSVAANQSDGDYAGTFSVTVAYN